MSETPKSPVSAKEKTKSKVIEIMNAHSKERGIVFRGERPDVIIFDDVQSWQEDHPWLNNLRDHARMLSGHMQIPHYTNCDTCVEGVRLRIIYDDAIDEEMKRHG